MRRPKNTKGSNSGKKSGEKTPSDERPVRRNHRDKKDGGERHRDSEVGYKKPPKAYSWKKGQSPNPAGRPKGSKNNRTIIISLMEGRLGRKIPDLNKLSAQEGMLLKAIQKGLLGDAKAMAFAFRRYDDATGQLSTGAAVATEDDEKVYATLCLKIRREIENEVQ